MNIATVKAFRAKFRTQKDLIEKLYLAAIIETYSRVKAIPGINGMKENDIRDKFDLDFQNNNTQLMPYIQNKTLYFTNENRIITIASKFRTDIEFIVSWYGRFVMECKRLSSAEQRYIDDGLIRFANLSYSSDENAAGMIGFVVSGNCQNITDNLKTKVETFQFHTTSKKLLTQLCDGWQYSFQSKHVRNGKSPIHVYHLFFEFL